MEDERMRTRLVSSMEKVFPEKELQARAFQRGEALRGERLNFQMAYCWEDAPGWAQIETESLLKGVTVRTVELEPAEYVCPVERDDNYLRTGPGLFPDILKPPEGELRLMPGQWRSLWVSIDTEEEEPGEYPVTVRIKTNEKTVGEETFLFRLLPQKLPQQSLIFTQWMHTDCIAQQYHAEVFSERWWELVERYVRFAAQHGVNMLLTPLFTPPLDTLPGTERPTVQLVDVKKTEGGWEFGYERLRRWIKMCRSCGIRYLEASHLFTQWGAAHAPKIMAEENGHIERIFGWETDSEGEEYSGFLKAFLPGLTDFFREEGLEGKVYFHVSDEPSGEHLERYGRLSALIHELTEGFPKMDALSDYEFYEKGLVDVPVCATNHIAPFLERGTPHLWAYYCCAQAKGVSNRFLAMPGARNRCIGLQLYDGRIEGFLHWGHNFWMTQYATKVIDPYRVSDAGGAFSAGDSFSVYPGEDGPVAAVGLELFLEALQDLRALLLAETLAGRERVQELYADVAFRNFGCSAREPEEVLEVRRRVNELIRETDRTHGLPPAPLRYSLGVMP